MWRRTGGGERRYGERADLWRAEGIWSQAPAVDRPLRWVAGAALHRQESTSGTREFSANQWIANADLLWLGRDLGGNQNLRGGASVQRDAYSDETPVDSDMNFLLPALFLGEARTKGQWSWIVGVRAESPCHLVLNSPLPTTPILAPRLNFKYALTPTWDTCFNMGRGYRRIQLFTEKHAALNGSRQIVIEQPLTPERGWSGHLSTHRALGHSDWLADIGMHAFAKRLAHQLVADYNAKPEAIVYRNIPGTDWSRVVGADIQASWRAT